MANPTRQEIIDAYEELYMLLGFYADRNPDRVPECRRIIEKVIPPRPQPTMAEVEWDDDKHRFAEAENPDHGEVIMLNVSQISGKVRIFFNQYGEFYLGYASPENLTPTGRRYTLTEIEND